MGEENEKIIRNNLCIQTIKNDMENTQLNLEKQIQFIFATEFNCDNSESIIFLNPKDILFFFKGW